MGTLNFSPESYSKKLLAFGMFFLFLFAWARTAEPQPGLTDDVSQAVSRAIPFLWKEGERWIDDHGCVSCHQIPVMVWSLSAAKETGFTIAEERLKTLKQWSVDPSSFVRLDEQDTFDLEQAYADNIDTMNMLLLALKNDSSVANDWKKSFSKSLINNQQEDGSWNSCGQLPSQKRPVEETTQTTVMWTLLALLGQDELPKDFDAALAKTFNECPQSTEYLAVRLLLSEQITEIESQPIRQELLNRQKTDGGWGWLSSEPSDALATGMATYALKTVGPCTSIEAAVTAAEQFLVRNQQPDGSWKVPGTKKKTRNHPTPTSDYWGTGWAVISLLPKINMK